MVAVDPSPERETDGSSIGPVSHSSATILVVAMGLFVALEIGSRIADSLATSEAWVCMAALTGPLVFVSVVFWLVGRLRQARLTVRVPKSD